jgi:hypothetical protein
MPVDPTLADQLKAAALFEAAEAPAVQTAWGEIAASSEIISPLAFRADAAAEATRQLALLQPVRSTDRHEINGLPNVAPGMVVTIISDDLDYAAGRAVIVRQVVSDRANNKTYLVVENRL